MFIYMRRLIRYNEAQGNRTARFQNRQVLFF